MTHAACVLSTREFLVRHSISQEATYETLHEEHPLPPLESSATIQVIELLMSAAAHLLHFSIYYSIIDNTACCQHNDFTSLKVSKS